MATIAQTLLQAATATKTTKGAEAIPTPMDLYNEAAPRVVKALKQYDAASPLIDWSTKNWWALVVGLTVIAVGGSYLGNLLYDKIHKRRA